MSMEPSGAAHIQKAPGSSASAHAKGQARAAGDAGGPPAGGFLSLLSSFEADAGGVAAGADQAGAGGLPGLVGERQPSTELGPADPLGQLQPVPAAQLPSDPALLLAQSWQAVGSGAVGQPGAAAPADAGLADKSAKGVSAVPPRAPAALGALDARAGAAALVLPPALPERVTQSSGELFKKALKTLPGNTLDARSGEAATGAGNAAPDWRELKPSFMADVASRSPSLAAAVAAAGASDAAGRPAERSSGKSVTRPVGGSGEGAWGAQALLAGGRNDAPAALTETALLPPEVLVAEQVKYWISSDVQNAELKLDGLGADPVEVSISLQGNEAHVAFRSDQAETRLVLENAVSHLKGLLASEGLVLSGVSVGTSGRQAGAGAQEERRGRQGGRQATVVTLEPVPADGLRRASRSSGRTVDLFV